MYLGSPCYGYALNCLFCNTRDTSVMHEKAKFVCFINMQPQKMKFKSFQLTMKQVLYIQWTILTLLYVALWKIPLV